MPQLTLILIRSLILLIVSLTAFAYLTYTERRVLAWFQWRVGPNRLQFIVIQNANDVAEILAPTGIGRLGRCR